MEQAQSLVEMAISLIILLMLLLGAVEFSLALFQYVTIRDAAQEGALYGSIHPAAPDEAAIIQHVIKAADDVLILDAANVSIDRLGDCEGSTSVAGVPTPNYITVNVTYLHNIAYPLVGPMIGTNTIRLNASATNTILQPSCP